MEKTQNITLSVPKSILQKAKILAVKKNVSLSSLLTQTLATLVFEDENYEKARQRNIRLLRKGLDLGTGGKATWSREDLHDRKSS